MFSVAVDIPLARRFYLCRPTLSKTKRVSRGPWLRGPLTGLALLSLLVFTVHGFQNPALGQSQQDLEILRAESWFKGKSLDEITLSLRTMLPAVVSQTDKELLMRELPFITSANRIRDPHQLSSLRARALPVLKFYKRDSVVDLILFKDERPIVYSKPGVLIAVSTKVLKIVGPDDAALAGIIAHESAHEYVAMQFLEADQAHDLEKLRELELFCDGVAVVVLLDLGQDPSKYGHAVTRIANNSRAASTLNDGSNSHPAGAARLTLISDVTTSLRPSLGTRSN